MVAQNNQNFLRLLILGILAIAFWVAVWDIIELVIDKYLIYINQKDNDNYRILILLILGIVSVILIYNMNGMDLIG